MLTFAQNSKPPTLLEAWGKVMHACGGVSKRDRYPMPRAINFYAEGPVDTPTDGPARRRQKKRQRLVAQERKRRRSQAEAQLLRWLASGDLKAWGHGVSDSSAIDPGRWHIGDADWDRSAIQGTGWRISGIVVDGPQLEDLLLRISPQGSVVKHRPGPKPLGHEDLQNRIHDLTKQILVEEQPEPKHGWKTRIRDHVEARFPSNERLKRATIDKYSTDALWEWEEVKWKKRQIGE
jgi:hypothetical protein